MATVDFDKIYQYLNTIQNLHPNIKLYLTEFEKIKKAHDLFEDQYSKELFISEFFLKVNNYLFSRDFAILLQNKDNFDKISDFNKSTYADLLEPIKDLFPKYGDMFYDIFINHQYRYTKDNLDIKPSNNDICFDIGACFGETSILFAKVWNAKKVYSFDILPENLEILQKLINYHKLGNRIIPQLIGFSDKEGIIEYVSDENSSCSIILNKEKFLQKYGNSKTIRTTPVTTIDNYCAEYQVLPTFIKTDIEGADLATLQGAKNTISNHRPTLALTVYHGIDHLYKMPLLMKDFNSDYRLRLYKHSLNYETVCYAF